MGANDLIVGNFYQQKEFLWVVEILYIGKTNIFVHQYKMDTECSYPIEMILKDFRDCTNKVSYGEH